MRTNWLVFGGSQGCELKEALAELEGTTVTVAGSPYTLRNLIMGDHMMLYKVSAAYKIFCH